MTAEGCIRENTLSSGVLISEGFGIASTVFALRRATQSKHKDKIIG